MPNIKDAYEWAIKKCNDDHVGYSQDLRAEQKGNLDGVPDVTYYDCSSFIYYSLKHNGFDVKETYPWTTGTMGAALKKLGFKEIPFSQGESKLKQGDIIMYDGAGNAGHTEMVHHIASDGYVTMGAHGRVGKALKDQVSIYSTHQESVRSSWQYIYTYGGVEYKWIKGNRYLSQEEMDNNAHIVWNYLGSQGWTLNAVCALLANMQSESSINPAIYESLIVSPSSGYGLVQWTPATKIQDRTVPSKYSGYDDGDWQLTQIIKDGESGAQWFANASVTPSNPPITFKEFEKSELDLKTLTNYFLWYFEHPEDPKQDRSANAKHYYELLQGEDPGPPPTPTSNKKFKWWMYCRRRYW